MWFFELLCTLEVWLDVQIASRIQLTHLNKVLNHNYDQ